jgi:hypothetical protein
VRHDVTVWVPLWLVRTVFACFALFGDVLPSLQDWRTPEKGAHSRMPRAPPPPPRAHALPTGAGEDNGMDHNKN